MINIFKQAFAQKDLRKKLLVVLFVLAIFRLVANIPIPGTDPNALKQLLASSQLFGMLNVVSGGLLESFSVATIGLYPYITMSWIIQMMIPIVPKLHEMSKDGNYGMDKINRMTRIGTVFMSILQSFGFYFYLLSIQVLKPLNTSELILMVVTLVAGTMIMLWLGDLIQEYGIGNGTSLIIFAGIVSTWPRSVLQVLKTTTSDTFAQNLTIAGFGLGLILLLILMNEGTRRLTVEYARRHRGGRVVGGQRSFLPLKVLHVGVMPLIFGTTMVQFPVMIASFMVLSSNELLRNSGGFIQQHMNTTSPAYLLLVFVLVGFFTFFSSTFSFNTEEIADDLKKNGGFLPGVRPGKSTLEYLNFIVNRINLPAAFFLGILAILPQLFQNISGLTSLALGGTGILIVVSVIIDLKKQLDSQLVTSDYEGIL